MKRAFVRCFSYILAICFLPALPLFTSNTGKTVAFSDFSDKRFLQSDLSNPAKSFTVPVLGQLAGIRGEDSHTAEGEAVVSGEGTEDEAAGEVLVLPETYLVLDAATGEVLSLTPVDYITGVTAAEMPAFFETEALKAQAVAAHTYALWQMGRQLENPDPDLKGAFLSTDPSRFQAYKDPAALRELWGDLYEENYARVREAAEAVIGKIMVYQGEPIVAAFHALSSGKTESAADIWGADIPYLAAADSASDAEVENYRTVRALPAAEVEAMLKSRAEGLELSGEPADWIQVTSRSDSGSVLTARVGNLTATGSELREWLSLPSADFTVEASEGKLLFTVLGRGHGVGLSQYGANAMAKAGASYEEILHHYYYNIQIVKASTAGAGD